MRSLKALQVTWSIIVKEGGNSLLGLDVEVEKIS